MYSSSTTSSSDYSNPVGGIMRPLVMDRGAAKWQYGGAAEIAPSCPRCASANTKFCYYNNYSLSQPRYFCKACRRYWTKGGSLRNVPVGGGCRKTRRARAAASRHPSAAAVADNSAAAAAIDMAAVFAKYVNQSSSSNDDDSLSPGSSSEHAPASALDDVYHTPLGLIGDDQMQQVMPQMSTCQDVTGQFLYQDCSNNGFDQLQLQQQEQGVLCEDILWAEGTTLQSFAYAQPMVQVEDCGLFAPDHDSNLVSDNWSSFDLSAYDFYSTP